MTLIFIMDNMDMLISLGFRGELCGVNVDIVDTRELGQFVTLDQF